MRELRFTVYGQAKPAGSKRIVPSGGKAGGRPIVIDASKGSADWKRQVAQAAGQRMRDWPLFEGPLELRLTFYVPRPKGHYGARGLKPSAPEYPTVRPDVLKLARGVEDALSKIAYRDDAQIATETLAKRYGEPARVEVYLAEADALPLEAAA